MNRAARGATPRWEAVTAGPCRFRGHDRANGAARVRRAACSHGQGTTSSPDPGHPGLTDLRGKPRRDQPILSGCGAGDWISHAEDPLQGLTAPGGILSHQRAGQVEGVVVERASSPGSRPRQPGSRTPRASSRSCEVPARKACRSHITRITDPALGSFGPIAGPRLVGTSRPERSCAERLAPVHPGHAAARPEISRQGRIQHFGRPPRRATIGPDLRDTCHRGPA